MTKLTLTRRVLILSLVFGLIILAALDFYVRRHVFADFSKQMTRQLQIQVNEGRLRFDRYVKGHYRLAQIIGGQQNFLSYIAKRDFSRQQEVLSYKRPPVWLPPISMLRQFTRVDYFILVDGDGKSREFYCSCKDELPEALSVIDAETLKASQSENFMTMLAGRPYILSSRAIGQGKKTIYLLLATEVNDTLLASMMPPYKIGRQIIALVMGYNPSVLTSSDIKLVPPGASMAELRDEYLIFSSKVFNYEYADLLITYAHLVPISDIEKLAAPTLRQQRIQLIFVAAIYTMLFLAIILWISSKIARITQEITAFSKECLGEATRSIKMGGNELDLLQDHFHLLAEQIRSTNRQQAILLEAVLNAIPAPLFYKDTKGVYRGCNKAFIDYIGKSSAEIINHDVYDIAPKELADIYYKADHELMSQGGKQVYEAKVCFADNTEHHVMFHKATYNNQNDKITGMVGVMIDITERIEAEASRKIMAEKLIQAQKMESIGTLAGGIAHDFNNILTIILGYTELAQLEVDEKSALLPHLKMVMDSGNRAKDLVQQILTFSRQSDHEKKPLSMVPIIKEAMKMLRSSIPSTIEFQQNIGADCGYINGDPTQIHQVIMNLCTNAYHAMREDGGLLAVVLTPIQLSSADTEQTPGLHPGGWLKLEVSDSGKGMDEETQNKIFEPYFTTKGQGEGTGLGLAVVHGIVMGHGGYINVYSEIGVGTTFQLYFPELPQIQEIDTPSEEALLQKGDGRILLVDDEEAILGMLSGILSTAGYCVTTFSDSQEALAAVTQSPHFFDIMITDMTMPGMTGYELAQNVLKLNPQLPIIMCTGYSELITKEKAIEAGIKRHVMKPVSGHQLAVIIHELL